MIDKREANANGGIENAMLKETAINLKRKMKLKTTNMEYAFRDFMNQVDPQEIYVDILEDAIIDTPR